jgi:hypothetical protein
VVVTVGTDGVALFVVVVSFFPCTILWTMRSTSSDHFMICRFCCSVSLLSFVNDDIPNLQHRKPNSFISGQTETRYSKLGERNY